MRAPRLISVALFLAITAAAAGPFSGTWKLNKQRSRFGDVTAPVDVTVNVTHNEPAIEWTGKVMDAQGENRQFQFKGARDGKEYPVEGAHGKGMMAIQAVGERESKSTASYADGKVTETSVTIVSADGKTLTQRVTLTTAKGKQTWTEVYDRQ